MPPPSEASPGIGDRGSEIGDRGSVRDSASSSDTVRIRRPLSRAARSTCGSASTTWLASGSGSRLRPSCSRRIAPSLRPAIARSTMTSAPGRSVSFTPTLHPTGSQPSLRAAPSTQVAPDMQADGEMRDRAVTVHGDAAADATRRNPVRVRNAIAVGGSADDRDAMAAIGELGRRIAHVLADPAEQRGNSIR